MSAATPALLAAAAGVGFGHAILPDHWLPLALLGRARRYPLARVARLSGLAGVAHVLMSIALGGLIIAVGVQFRSVVEGAENTIIGGLLVATGLGFVILELTGHGHHHGHDDDGAHHHHHGDGHAHDHAHGTATRRRRIRSLIDVMVPFGAAASPDLTILPVFLAATAAGVPTAVTSLLIFAAVTILTIVGLTLFACFGGYQIRGQWLERWGNGFTALVLLVIGALLLAGLV